VTPGAWAVLVLAGLAGGWVAARWLRALSRSTGRRTFVWHVAAGPFMVAGTVPAVLALRGEFGGGWPALAALAVAGILWLAGLRCLLQGHLRRGE